MTKEEFIKELSQATISDVDFDGDTVYPTFALTNNRSISYVMSEDQIAEAARDMLISDISKTSNDKELQMYIDDIDAHDG